MQMCHLNGNSHDDRLQNLRWGTVRDNADDRVRHGVNREVNRNRSYAQLSLALAEEIRATYASGGGTHKALARQFGVAKASIYNVLHGRTWRTAP